jgi:hypothetical protein
MPQTDIAKHAPQAAAGLQKMHEDSAIEYCAVSTTATGLGSSLATVAAASAGLQHGDVSSIAQRQQVWSPPATLR